MTTAQLACTYAALILSESGKTDAASIIAVTKAAGVEVSQGMAAAFSKAISSVNVNQVLGGISFGGAAAGGAAAPAAAAGASAGAAAAPAAAAKKEEPEEEGDDDMGFGLFD
ncbi:60S acidic ribosomal protein [Novymonas esmeraldas]|uniref:60S acidic ribosomal protein n=1 Tax=Novymonas esmeraldas TaxID=1808958 RepID=A0AAW0EU83_9TRYP